MHFIDPISKMFVNNLFDVQFNEVSCLTFNGGVCQRSAFVQTETPLWVKQLNGKGKIEITSTAVKC